MIDKAQPHPSLLIRCNTSDGFQCLFQAKGVLSPLLWPIQKRKNPPIGQNTPSTLGSQPRTFPDWRTGSHSPPPDREVQGLLEALQCRGEVVENPTIWVENWESVGSFTKTAPTGGPTQESLPSTTLDLDTPLNIEPAAFAALNDRNSFAVATLHELTANGADGYSAIQFWPEHFHPEHFHRGTGRFWNESFGASLAYD